MEPRRLAAVALLLIAVSFPAFGKPAGGGPKNWFHLRKSSPSTAHYRGNHTVVKHHATKHPKPQHITHSH